MRPGTRVEVRSRFESRWTRGFEIVDQIETNGETSYEVRRRSDGSILPVRFTSDDVREEHRRGTWWL
ncbi:MAG TPA: hypothetical protein VN636_13550 [Acidimicrobiia bacterium]|nr:hypothetical protein [Acidimicrobiia bacterium]